MTHSWTEQELRVVCVCYMEQLPIELALRLTNTTNERSMEMRYRNCLFLDKGRVEGALSHASITHQKVWKEVKEFYKTKQRVTVEPQEKEVHHIFEYVLILGTALCVALAILIAHVI